MALRLSANEALIFRVTHISNVPWILNNGLHCKNSDISDPNFVQIGNPELISKRATRNIPIPPNRTLSDYVSFYFTPHSIMMYNIKTGYGGIRQFSNSEIVIMVTSLHDLVKHGVTAVYTDRHAYLSTARFYSSLDDLDKIDWSLLQSRDFRRDYDNPEKTDRYQAEALVYKHLPVEQLMEIICHETDNKRVLLEQMMQTGKKLKIEARPSCFF